MSVVKDLSDDDLRFIAATTRTECTVRGDCVIAPDRQVFFFRRDDERSYRAALARCRAVAEKVSINV